MIWKYVYDLNIVWWSLTLHKLTCKMPILYFDVLLNIFSRSSLKILSNLLHGIFCYLFLQTFWYTRHSHYKHKFPFINENVCNIWHNFNEQVHRCSIERNKTKRKTHVQNEITKFARWQTLLKKQHILWSWQWFCLCMFSFFRLFGFFPSPFSFITEFNIKKKDKAAL